MGLISFLSTLPWWLPIGIVFSGNILFFFLTKFFYNRIYPKVLERGHKVLGLFFKTFYGPLQLIIAISGFSVIVSLYAGHLFDVSVIAGVKKVIQFAVIVSASWVAFRFCREVEKIVLTKKHLDTTTIELFSKLSLILILFFTTLMVLPLFGIQIAGILTLGGIGAGAVAFSAKDALANIWGGIVIAIDKPFKIGEWIYNIGESMEGVVEHIGWRYTMLRQFDKRPLYIPNSTFSTLVFINASRMTNRRIQKIFGVRYCDSKKMPVILEEIREYIKKRPDIDHTLTNYVHVVEFAESSLQIKVRMYTKSVVFIEYMQLTEIVLLDIHEIIVRNGAQIAYPTQTVDHPDSHMMAAGFGRELGNAIFGNVGFSLDSKEPSPDSVATE